MSKRKKILAWRVKQEDEEPLRAIMEKHLKKLKYKTYEKRKSKGRDQRGTKEGN